MSDLKIAPELARSFNMLAGSSGFTIKVEGGKSYVRKMDRLQAGTGVWLVGGQSVLANGNTVASVFEISTDPGTEVFARCYWNSPKGWCDTSDQPACFEMMGLERAALFPCRFESSVPLDEDLSARAV